MQMDGFVADQPKEGVAMEVAFACVTVGVMLAIFFGKSRDNQHIW